MTGKVDWEKKADRMVQVFSSSLADAPMAYTQFLNFLDFFWGPSQEIVIAGDPGGMESQAATAMIQKRFQPSKVVLFKPEDDQGQRLSTLCPFVAGMGPVGGKTTVFICEGFSCKAPLTDLAALQAALG